QDEKFFSHYHPHGEDSIEKNLAKLSYQMNDVTDVFLTHLLFDHSGVAIKKENGQLKPAFEKAIFWTNEQHLNAALHPNVREKASFLKENIVPMQECNQLQFITTDENKAWMENIEILLADGHTEAMMLPLID